MNVGATGHDLREITVRGWDVLRLVSEDIAVDVVPGKGGDILAVRWRETDLDVLWTTPWGLREKGSASTAGDSRTAFIESYPGGWQTLFPNGGPPADEQGVQLAFHGEATTSAWEWSRAPADGVAVTLTTVLVRSPFSLQRRIDVTGATVTVTETFRNDARTEQQAMWSHHPAFGAPFLDAGCVLETGAGAFLSDSGYDTPNGDLAVGVRSTWPHVAAKDGTTADLRQVPGPDAEVDRFGYLLDFAEPWYSLTNPALGLTATVRWDAAAFPSAWYWCEAAGTAAFPWHQRAYVLAVEPAASHPGAGLPAARANGTAVTFAPGETRTAVVTLTMSASDAPGAP